MSERPILARGLLTFFALLGACAQPAPPVLPAPAQTPPPPVAPAAQTPAEPPTAMTPPGPVDAVPAPPPASPPAPLSEWKASASVGTSPEGNTLPVLPRFFTALLRLSKGERSEHVRIAWLGDSHTQPDLWTHAVRRPLQDRFGTGGPGFMHVGWKKWGYRHSGADLSVHGRWRIEPPRLLSVKTYDDGVLGLGGVRLIPEAGARAGIDVSPASLPGPGRWEMALRTMTEDARLRITPQGAAAIEVVHESEGPRVRHVAWSSEGPGGGFEVESLRGRTELFGVVAEVSDPPGVVLDVLGLNGARVVHTLTWDAPSWTAALARRKPDLVILAYGTNESGIRHLSMERHRQRLGSLLGRAREASPNVDCLIIGAMDRGGDAMSARIERINDAQAAAARDHGCAFWSAQRAMGGRDAMQRWASAEPPWASADRVHLKARGYDRLGRMLARDLLTGFEGRQPVEQPVGRIDAPKGAFGPKQGKAR